MKYQVLARKWRPKSFEQILDQDHVTRALKNALDNNRLHHAYLFTGTRGVGKTTLARIFAKCLNCLSGVSSNPCGECIACREIDNGHFIDLIEIDAASRTKVEDTRELLDNVQYAPTYGRYKVYLIDEVHMLSGHSFNALLKTLEEPPSHVKFLLATTDPQKIPITILSRCLQFNLKVVSSEKITNHLASILQQEEMSFDISALQQLTRASEGSVRDALSLLDQAIAYGNNDITLANVNLMLGAIGHEHLFEIINALVQKDAAAAFATINLLAEQAVDFANVLENLLSLLHNIALIQKIPTLTTDYELEKLKHFSTLLTPEDVQLFYQIGLIGRRDLPYAPNPKTGFEMTILRMLSFYPINNNEVKKTDIKKTQSTPTITEPPKVTIPPAAQSTAITPELKADNWNNILEKLNLSAPTQSLAINCIIGSIEENNVELLLHSKYAPILNPRHEKNLTDAFSELFQRSIKVRISLTNNINNTPQVLRKEESDKKQKIAENIINNNDSIQNILKTFNAAIIPQSIKQEEVK